MSQHSVTRTKFFLSRAHMHSSADSRIRPVMQVPALSRGLIRPGQEGAWRGNNAPAPKSPNNVASTFFSRVNFLPKDLRCELVSFPERHRTSARPCLHSLFAPCELRISPWFLAEGKCNSL